MKKLAKLGFEKKPAEDSRAFLIRVETSKLVQTTEIEVIIDLYNQIKYGPVHTGKDSSEYTSQSDLKMLNLFINNFRPN